MKRMVNVYIEELVLHGFEPGERHRIAASVEQELARLVRERGVGQPMWNPVSIDRVNGGVIHLHANQPPAATGAGISRAIYRSLSHRQMGSRR
jgi:hypothetical protein